MLNSLLVKPELKEWDCDRGSGGAEFPSALKDWDRDWDQGSGATEFPSPCEANTEGVGLALGSGFLRSWALRRAAPSTSPSWISFTSSEGETFFLPSSQSCQPGGKIRRRMGGGKSRVGGSSSLTNSTCSLLLDSLQFLPSWIFTFHSASEAPPRIKFLSQPPPCSGSS